MIKECIGLVDLVRTVWFHERWRDGEMSTQLLFQIYTDGMWKPISGHMEGLPARGPHKQELLDDFGTEFAKAIMYHNMWVERDGDEIKVSRG